MLIEASNIIGLPIAAIDTQSKIGEVEKIIVNPEDGEIIGFLVSTGGFFKKQMALSAHDVLDIDKNGIVVNSNENILSLDEIVRIKEILKNKITIFNQNAFTVTKKNLGKIYDFLINLETFMVVKYYVKNILTDRIIPSDKVVKIEKSGVYFSDDIIEQTPTGEIEGAAA